MRVTTAPGTVPGNLTVAGTISVAGLVTATAGLNVSGGDLNVSNAGGRNLNAVIHTPAAHAQAFEANSGGVFQLDQATGIALSGPNQVRLEVVAGTTGSKLIAVGPTGSQTILDNII